MDVTSQPWEPKLPTLTWSSLASRHTFCQPAPYRHTSTSMNSMPMPYQAPLAHMYSDGKRSRSHTLVSGVSARRQTIAAALNMWKLLLPSFASQQPRKHGSSPTTTATKGQSHPSTSWLGCLFWSAWIPHRPTWNGASHPSLITLPFWTGCSFPLVNLKC